MSGKVSYLALIVALLALLMVFFRPSATVMEQISHMPQKETVFERIMRTGTMRCGYILAPAWVMKDPNTGAMSGTIVDYVNALGDALKLKVVWQEEMNLGTYMQDLQNGRYDLECSGGWPNAMRGKQIEYSKPIYFFPLYAVARADDHRFDNNYAAMDAPDVRITAHDGGTDAEIRTLRFPHATASDIPGSAQETDTFQEVISHKADVAIDDYATIAGFIKANPNTIHRIDGAPLRIIPANLSFAPGEFRLQQMLNTATDQLMFDGVIEKIIQKYEPAPGVFLRIAPPYVVPGKP